MALAARLTEIFPKKNGILPPLLQRTTINLSSQAFQEPSHRDLSYSRGNSFAYPSPRIRLCHRISESLQLTMRDSLEFCVSLRLSLTLEVCSACLRTAVIYSLLEGIARYSPLAICGDDSGCNVDVARGNGDGGSGGKGSTSVGDILRKIEKGLNFVGFQD
ncbi:hypothetical protein HZH68_003282 [Vespula germanica]|uniref:Uncharacterized protein n=1 Tax=Vespula germanica TaxID=30212 RepID=A0A834U357_VESGE|nr:hypothetical protein HZH68_003282 [Vespula germanica]